MARELWVVEVNSGTAEDEWEPCKRAFESDHEAVRDRDRLRETMSVIPCAKMWGYRVVRYTPEASDE